MEDLWHQLPSVDVLKDFVGSPDKKQINLRQGERVWVVRKVPLNERGVWFLGYNATGDRGLFPGRCIDARKLREEDLVRGSVIDQKCQVKRLKEAKNLKYKVISTPNAATESKEEAKNGNISIVEVTPLRIRSGKIVIEDAAMVESKQVVSVVAQHPDGSRIDAKRDGQGRFVVQVWDDNTSIHGPIIEIRQRDSIQYSLCAAGFIIGAAKAKYFFPRNDQSGFYIWYQASGMDLRHPTLNVEKGSPVEASFEFRGCKDISVLLSKAQGVLTLQGVSNNVVTEFSTTTAKVGKNGRLVFGEGSQASGELSFADIRFGLAQFRIVSLSEDVDCEALVPLAVLENICHGFLDREAMLTIPLHMKSRLGSVRAATLTIAAKLLTPDVDQAVSTIGKELGTLLDARQLSNAGQTKTNQGDGVDDDDVLMNQAGHQLNHLLSNKIEPTDEKKAKDSLDKLLSDRNLNNMSSPSSPGNYSSMASSHIDKLLTYYDQKDVDTDNSSESGEDDDGRASVYSTDNSSEEDEDDDQFIKDMTQAEAMKPGNISDNSSEALEEDDGSKGIYSNDSSSDEDEDNEEEIVPTKSSNDDKRVTFSQEVKVTHASPVEELQVEASPIASPVEVSTSSSIQSPVEVGPQTNEEDDSLETLRASLKSLLKTAQEDHGVSLKQAFLHFDKEGHGFISKAELKEGLESLAFDITKSQLSILFADFDTNVDGKISLGEFMSFAGIENVVFGEEDEDLQPVVRQSTQKHIDITVAMNSEERQRYLNQQTNEDPSVIRKHELEKKIVESPQEVALYLCQQEQLEAVRRGLGGCLILPREVLWRCVAEMGLWENAAAKLGKLNGEVVLPLLDGDAFAATLSLEAGNLTAKQLRKGFFDLLYVEDVEKYYEHWQLSEIEMAAEGYEETKEEEAEREKWQSLFLQPLEKWPVETVANFIKICGGDPTNFRDLGVRGLELATLERQGTYGLEEGLISLGLVDALVRQRIQYQISLLALRSPDWSSNQQTLLSCTARSLNFGDNNDEGREDQEYEKEDTHWWAGSSFGVRSRIALEDWAIEDVLRFCQTLRLREETLQRLEKFAIDGRSLGEITPEEMYEELGLNQEETQIVSASVLLLKRPPQLDFGKSDYLHLRLANQQHSAWFGKDGTLCLAHDRVHTLILRPAPGLLKAVDYAQKKLKKAGSRPTVRIWFRLLEYQKQSCKGDGGGKQQGWKQFSNSNATGKSNAKSKKKSSMNKECYSFSDAGAPSMATILRMETSGASAERLTRWEPLHPLLKSHTGIVNGWRHLATTSVDRGVHEECSRINLCFDATQIANQLTDPKMHYRICFAVQVGSIQSIDDGMVMIPIPLNDGIGNSVQMGTHMFTMSPIFKIKRQFPSKPISEQPCAPPPLKNKKNKGGRKKVFVKKQSVVPKPNTKPKVSNTTKSAKVNRAPVKAVPKTVTDNGGFVSPSSLATSPGKRVKETHQTVYAHDFQQARIQELEHSQRLVQRKLEEMTQAKKSEDENADFRTAAAFQLGALLGGVNSSSKAEAASKSQVVNIDVEITNKLQSMQTNFASQPSLYYENRRKQADQWSPKSTDSSSSSSSSSTDGSESSSSSLSSSQRWGVHTGPSKPHKVKTGDWVDEMTIAAPNCNNRPPSSPERSTKENNVEVLDEELEEDMATLWADRISSRFLENEIVTYPLRPNTVTNVNGAKGFLAERCFKQLRLAICRVGASTVMTMLNALDIQRRGWLDESQFAQFLVDLGHGDILNEVMENLGKADQKLVTELNGKLYIRYERLVYQWTMDDEVYANCLARRLWDLSEHKDFELLYFIESTQSVELGVLKELDPDIDNGDLDLLLNHKSHRDYLDTRLLRARKERFWEAVLSKLKEKQQECLELFQKYDNQSTEEITVENFCKALKQLLSLHISEEELVPLKTRYNLKKSSKIPYQHLFAFKHQGSQMFDPVSLLKHAQQFDVNATGFLSLEDMQQALRASIRSSKSMGGAFGKECLEKARELSKDYAKRGMQFVKWIQMTFQIRHDLAVQAELQRFARWFQLLASDGKQEHLVYDLTNSGTPPTIARSRLQQVLSEHGFVTTYLYDICIMCKAQVVQEINYETLLHKCATNDAIVSPALQLAVLNRVTLSSGGVDRALKELALVDHDFTGFVQFDVLQRILQCSREELQLVLANSTTFSQEQGIQYETLLLDLLNKLKTTRTFAKSFVHHKLRRSIKRCETMYGKSLYELFLSHDEERTGRISLHQLSWELRMLQVDIECEGTEGEYLLEEFAPGRRDGEVDYEQMILKVLLEDALTNDEKEAIKRTFVLHYFRRKVGQVSSQFIGMLHIFDSCWNLLEDRKETGICTDVAFRAVLRKAFQNTTNIDDSTFKLALKFAIEVYGQDSKQGQVEFERFSLDVSNNNETTDDMLRHTVTEVMRLGQKTLSGDLYDFFRTYDGDLNGTISIRMMNQGLAKIGCNTLTEEAFRYLNVINDEKDNEGVFYELFLERVAALFKNIQPRLSSQRLRSILRRINEKAIKKGGFQSSKQVFLHFLEQTETNANGLNEWDIFYILREHRINVQTIEELTLALQELLLETQQTTTLITLLQWLKIV